MVVAGMIVAVVQLIPQTFTKTTAIPDRTTHPLVFQILASDHNQCVIQTGNNRAQYFLVTYR